MFNAHSRGADVHAAGGEVGRAVERDAEHLTTATSRCRTNGSAAEITAGCDGQGAGLVDRPPRSGWTDVSVRASSVTTSTRSACGTARRPRRSRAIRRAMARPCRGRPSRRRRDRRRERARHGVVGPARGSGWKTARTRLGRSAAARRSSRRIPPDRAQEATRGAADRRSARVLPAGGSARVGLGDTALCRAVAPQLGHRRSRRSAPAGRVGEDGRARASRSISPLAAPTPLLPQQASPYFPSSRLFRNPLFLSIEEVPGARGLPDSPSLARGAAR